MKTDLATVGFLFVKDRCSLPRAAVALLTIICGLRENIRHAKAYKVIVLVQLLIVPIVAAMGFHYATQPPA